MGGIGEGEVGEMSIGEKEHTCLLLQPDNAGPFLLEQRLVLLGGLGAEDIFTEA